MSEPQSIFSVAIPSAYTELGSTIRNILRGEGETLSCYDCPGHFCCLFILEIECIKLRRGKYSETLRANKIELKKLYKNIHLSPWAAGGHAEGLLVGLAQAADAEDDGDHDQGHGGGQHHVQHHVEV